MFKKTPSDETVWTQQVYVQLLAKMSETDPTSPEYAKLADQMKKINEARALIAPKLIDPNQLIAAAASVGGILLIIGYEQKHVVTSKAISFVNKMLS